MFRPISDIRNSTGLVFGFPGAPVLEVAVDRAVQAGAVGIITAANIAAARLLQGNAAVVGAVQVGGQKELQDLITRLSNEKKRPEAVVFHGLSEYANIVANEISGNSQPSQAQWGDMAREVSNDLRRLQAVAQGVYVTCDVIYDDEGKPKLNITPGLQKLILGDLVEKLFVYKQSGDNGAEIIVQDDPVAALAFQRVKRERPASEAAATDGSGRRINGGNRERRLR